MKLHTPKIDFQLYVIGGLKEGRSLWGILSSFSEKYGVKVDALNKRLLPLKKWGVISRSSYAVWEFNEEAFRQYQKNWKELENTHRVGQKKNWKMDRRIGGHGFQVVTKIIPPKKWDCRAEYLAKVIPFHPIPQGQRIEIHHGKSIYKVWLCNESIIFYFPEGKRYYEYSALESYLSAIYTFKQLIKKVERLLGISLRINKGWQFTVPRAHYAHIKNALAKKSLAEKRKYYVRDKHNKVWFIIDDSFNLNEAETIRSGTAKEDMDLVIHPLFQQLEQSKLTEPFFAQLEEQDKAEDYLNQLEQNKEQVEIMLPQQQTQMINEIGNMLNQFAQSLKIYGEHVVTHKAFMQGTVETQKATNEALVSLVSAVKDLKEVVKKNG